jgi:hypothetical protein
MTHRILNLARPIDGNDEIIYRQLCTEGVLQNTEREDFSFSSSILLCCPDFRRSPAVVDYISQQKGTTFAESGVHFLGHTGGATLLDPTHSQCQINPGLDTYILEEIIFAISGLQISHVMLQAHCPCGRQTACGHDFFSTLTSLDVATRRLRAYLDTHFGTDTSITTTILPLFDIHTRDGMRTYRPKLFL